MLRLRQILVLFEHDIRTVLSNLGVLASTHAELPMAARTWGQQATPTSFGAVTASWGIPLLGLLDELPNLRRTSLLVSLSGAAGTSAALGLTATKQRATLAASLGLNDPQRSWHTDRTPILALTGWMNRCVVALAKMAEDVLSLTQTEIAEVIMKDAGSSSTMPQKQNPVRPSVIAALAVQVSAANGALHTMGIQRLQRDGAAWFAEWAMLPQIVMGTAAALQQAAALTTSLAPDADKMRSNLVIGSGLIHAEALSFALASMMPRPKAQIETKVLCKTALAEGKTVEEVARTAYLNLAPDLFDPARQMGLAPTEARAFAARVRALK
jgi:3-carboxy-cis,cis-muconate cycloisomerase